MSSQVTPPGPTEPARALAGTHNRARAARLARRAAQFNKFRLIQLNLVPLVDTFVSVVFFTLVTATVGELAPVVNGVNLPESRVGQPAMQQITLGIGPQLTLAGRPIMTTIEAAQARSDDPAQPLVIPALYAALRTKADSIRTLRSMPAGRSIDAPLAIQGDRTMRYDLLSRVMQTARLAGFRNLTLQVTHIADAPPRAT
jgi:biopolymer transport protein ExbD